MQTEYTILRASGERVTHSVDLPQDPHLQQLEAIVLPVIGERNWMVRVGLTFEDHPVDMFVDEFGHAKELPLNLTATLIYHAHIAGPNYPFTNPEGLPYIVGDVVLFHRRVWF
ncbi:MAG: hypothetical protein ACRC9H_15195 [Aeromonas veronii]